jgi:photosystem II stability/assembly factor-like uncharacterized protein
MFRGAWLRNSRKDPKRPRLFLEPLEDRTLPSATWNALGPAPLSQAGLLPIAPVSGRITGIAADPGNANIVYVATAGGGIWKSINADSSSQTWTPLTDNIPGTTDSMGAIAIAPGNDQVLYAGTGEANNSEDSNYGEGILVSTNGGSSWTLENPGGIFTRLSVARIAVDPTNADIAYAAVGADGPNGNDSGSLGVYKTTDGGATWTNTTTSITTSNAFSDVVLDPKDPSIVYAAVGNIFGSSANGIYESTNGGTSWSLLSGFPHGSGTNIGRIALAISPTNPSVIYAAASDPSGKLAAFEVSTDGGADWTNRTSTTPNFAGGQGWYDLTLAVDPSNANTVYAGGQAGTNGLIESRDGGQNWTDISSGTNGSPTHGDYHALAFDANGKLLEGDDGGIFRLDNNDLTTPNITWTDLNGNLNTIQFYDVSIDPTTGNLLGGSQDNGTALYNSVTQKWTQTGAGGDGGMAYINGTLAYHVSPVADVGSANFFQVTSDGGLTWTGATNGLNGSDNMNYYPVFAVDPNNADRVVFGSNQLYQTTNAAGSWTKITSTGVKGWNPKGNPVDAIGLAASDANTLYAATGGTSASSSQLFVSSDGGTTWTERDLPAGNGRVNQILVDPTSAQTAYVVVSSFTSGAGHVWKTTNGGQSWTDISGNLPNLPTWSIQLDTGDNVLFVGNDQGVYYSTDGGSVWSPFASGLANVQVFSLDYSSTLNVLAAGTHGRGAWEVSTAVIPPQVTSNPSNQTVFVSQTATFTAAANGSSPLTVQWQYSTDSGKTFTNLNGDTSTTLSLPNVTLAMNGYEYRAVFSNSAGTAATSAATLTVNNAAPPTITSGNSATFTVGQGGSFTVTATGIPTPSLTESGALPSGVTFTDNGNGTATLGGTPAAGTQGTYPFSITAHNGIGSDFKQNFTLTVNPVPPPPSPPPPPPPPGPPSLNVPPLLALFDSLLGGIETVNANGTETITDSILGIPLIVATFDGSGNLVSVTLLGINVTFLFG